jgi:hypothetical protein
MPNAVGCPYILQEYVHGYNAATLAKSHPGEHEGIPPEFEEKVWLQIADIMTQLAYIRLAQFGFIRLNASGIYFVGALAETGIRPYDFAAAFL